jgi:hypothetical protein
VWVDLRLHLFLCVVVIQKSSKDNFSWDVFAAQYSPILNCKIQDFIKQAKISKQREGAWHLLA